MTLFNLFYISYLMNAHDFPSVSALLVQMIEKILVIYSFDFLLLQFLLILILNFSLKRSLPQEKRLVTTIVKIEIVLLGLNLLQKTVSVFVAPLFSILLPTEQQMTFAQYHSYFVTILPFFDLIFPVLMLKLFSRNHFRYANLFFIVIIARIFMDLLPSLVNRIFQNDLYNIVYTLFYLTANIIPLFIFYLASKKKIPLNKPEMEQFAINKALD